MNKVFKINEGLYDVDVVVVLGTYRRGGHLSVSLYCRPDQSDPNAPFSELYDVITVNFRESATLPADSQFVDVNNHPDIESWLISNHIAEPLEIWRQSGFCRYPAYRFYYGNR